MKLGAVILAAGAGTRLGGVAKALLTARDGRTFLGAILANARGAGLVESVAVVAPPYADIVAAKAAELGARVVMNPHPERGMASSIALGFAALAETDCDAAWLWPVDHPDVSPTTLRALVEALGDHAAARPVFDGHGGHPPLVARALWPRLADCAHLADGARGVLASADTVAVPVNDAGVLRDIDTLEDARAAR